MNKLQHKSRRAFSLIELAAIIAITGLMAGTIMSGQAMLKLQRLKLISTDAVTYKTAMMQFKQKYDYLPGDIPTATQLWGRADGGSPITSDCAAPTTTAAVGKSTCNGDGNGFVYTYEGFRAWQHMQAAGMLVGNLSGIANAACTSTPTMVTPPGMIVSMTACPGTAGTNLPRGSVERSVYSINSSGIQPLNNVFQEADYNNAITFGREGNIGPIGGTNIISGRDAYEVDMKYDDGAPGYGTIVSGRNSACASTQTSYVLASDAANCTLTFLDGFARLKGQN